MQQQITDVNINVQYETKDNVGHPYQGTLCSEIWKDVQDT